MLKKSAVIKIAARTDVGLEREMNEDNFIVCPDLTKNSWSFDNKKEFELGKYGSLLVVADGMGGMAAGEVASEIAIESMKEYFPLILKNEPELSDSFIKTTLKGAVLFANQKIVNHQKHDIKTEGMGTTLVLVWLVNNNLFCSWSGDSRCYLFNPTLSENEERRAFFSRNKRIVTGNLVEVSKDHSYVQELIDHGKLTPEQAFYHPANNQVTQSLGSETHVPKPDYITIEMQPGDRILICTDGLNGMLFDKQINEIIQQQTDINECIQELINNAKKAGGNDNITVVMADIINVASERIIKPAKKSKTIVIFGSTVIIAVILILFGISYFSRCSFDKIIVQESFSIVTTDENTIFLQKGDTLSIKSQNPYLHMWIVEKEFSAIDNNKYKIIIAKGDTLYAKRVMTPTEQTIDHGKKDTTVTTASQTIVDDNTQKIPKMSHSQVNNTLDSLKVILNEIKETFEGVSVKKGINSNNFIMKINEVIRSCDETTAKENLKHSDIAETCSGVNEIIELRNKLKNLKNSKFETAFSKLVNYQNTNCKHVNLPTQTGQNGNSRKDGDTSGLTLIYDEIKVYVHNLAPARKGAKWCFVDRNKNQRIPLEYDNAYVFSTDGYAAVQKGNKWGFIDTIGRLIIDYKYERTFDGFQRGIAKVQYEGDTIRINTTGQKIEN